MFGPPLPFLSTTDSIRSPIDTTEVVIPLTTHFWDLQNTITYPLLLTDSLLPLELCKHNSDSYSFSITFNRLSLLLGYVGPYMVYISRSVYIHIHIFVCSCVSPDYTCIDPLITTFISMSIYLSVSSSPCICSPWCYLSFYS